MVRKEMKFTSRLFLFVLIAAVSLPALPVRAQTPDRTGPAGRDAQSGREAEEAPALPRTFRQIGLGMDLEALKSSLLEDPVFYFRGDRDVSFLPAREQSLVETTGFSFIRRAFFQLLDGKLFIMAFTLDSGLVDHYSVYTAFVKKYGEPRYLDPKQAVWESGETRVSIERPLTVKYLDRQVFDAVIAESRAAESAELYLREEFLRGF
jgi:hypothetical protein